MTSTNTAGVVMLPLVLNSLMQRWASRSATSTSPVVRGRFDRFDTTVRPWAASSCAPRSWHRLRVDARGRETASRRHDPDRARPAVRRPRPPLIRSSRDTWHGANSTREEPYGRTRDGTAASASASVETATTCHGMRSACPGERGRRTDAALSVLSDLIAGKAVDVQGTRIQLSPGVSVPPIIVGGMAEAALARAARNADG